MAKQDKNIAGWQKASSQVFWAEIATCNHIVQIYENDKIVLDSLEGFVINGFETGDGVVIMASEGHLNSLNLRLLSKGYDVNSLCSSNQYIPLNAEKCLAKFMKDGWPDEQLFISTVNEIVGQAATTGRKVRAYGEMVAILWMQGHTAATIRLEYLWNKFCRNNEFCLFCAYPKTGFTQNVEESIAEIIATHS